MLSPPYTIVPTKVTVPLSESEYLAAKFKEGILALGFGEDVVASLLRTEALPFRHFHDGGNLPHVGDGGLFDGHAVEFGAVVAHWPFGVHSRANFCASAI